MPSGLDLATIGHVAIAVCTVLSVASAAVLLLLRGTFADKAEVNKKVDELVTRMTVIEQVASPSFQHEVSNRLGKLEGDIKEINAKLDALKETQDHNRRSLDTIQQYLLEQKS